LNQSPPYTIRHLDATASKKLALCAGFSDRAIEETECSLLASTSRQVNFLALLLVIAARADAIPAQGRSAIP